MAADAESRVRSWLEGSGYPLEMKVASAFSPHSDTVILSEYYRDPGTGESRETDVAVYKARLGENAAAKMAVVIECKSQTKRPWVLLSSRRRLPSSVGISQRVATRQGLEVLGALSDRAALGRLSLLGLPELTGYSLIQAFPHEEPGSARNDHAYSALMSVTNAARGIVDEAESCGPGLVMFAWPMLVVKAPLFQSWLDDEGELQLKEIDYGVLTWRNSPKDGHTIVAVARDHFVLERAGGVVEEVDRFLGTVVGHLSKVGGNA